MLFTTFAIQAALVSVAVANDIRFYARSSCNDSEFAGCYGVAAQVCCTVGANSAFGVGISKSSGSDFARMFSGGGCANQACAAGGAGTFCCVAGGSGLTGGFWSNGSRRVARSPEEAETCTSSVEPNVFGFVVDGSALEITADSVDSFDALHAEFKRLDVSDSEKQAWLESRGAVYNDLNQGEVTIATVS